MTTWQRELEERKMKVAKMWMKKRTEKKKKVSDLCEIKIVENSYSWCIKRLQTEEIDTEQ